MLTSLALATLLFAAASPAPAQTQAAQRILEPVCRTWAGDPKTAWALAHGITAFGASFKASDGRLAADVIMSDFLRETTAHGKAQYGFPDFRDGVPVQPHANLIVKTFVNAGIPEGRGFQSPFGPLPFKELYRSFRETFRFVEQDGYFQAAAWSLDALAAREKLDATWSNELGEKIELRRVVQGALADLEAQDRFLEEAMAAGQSRVDKRRQFIYEHPCGGFHFVQAVGAWMAHPEVPREWKQRFGRQIPVLFFRLSSETPQYEEALKLAPEHRLLLLSQKLKFYGHWLETIGRFRKLGLLRPDPKQKDAIAQAKAELTRAATELEQEKAFERMPEIRKTQPQVYLDLVGDSCHAVNGLGLMAK